MKHYTYIGSKSRATSVINVGRSGGGRCPSERLGARSARSPRSPRTPRSREVRARTYQTADEAAPRIWKLEFDPLTLASTRRRQRSCNRDCQCCLGARDAEQRANFDVRRSTLDVQPEPGSTICAPFQIFGLGAGWLRPDGCTGTVACSKLGIEEPWTTDVATLCTYWNLGSAVEYCQAEYALAEQI